MLLFQLDFQKVDANDSTISAAVSHLPCGKVERARWAGIHRHIDDLLPRYSGRLNFVLLRSDLSAIDAIRKELLEGLALPAEILQVQAEMPFQAGQNWTECHSALLTVRGLLLMAQVTGKPAAAPQLATAFSASILTAPWLEILLSGWQVFTILATLARWASPHLDDRLAQASGSHGRAAQRGASLLGPAACDSAEIGATAAARSLLGKVWRHRDPNYIEMGPSSSQAREIEEALAGLHGVALESAGLRGHCHWTQHMGRSLGGSLSAHEDLVFPADHNFHAEQMALHAMNVCDQIPECAGVTSEPSGHMSLRLGDPLLDDSPSGDSSFVHWCMPTLIAEGHHQSDYRNIVNANDAEDPENYSRSHAVCPFGRAMGLLATAFRRLGDAASIDTFAPELVTEAQAEVSMFVSHNGQRAAHEAWTSQWPVWQVLGRLQQRLDLLLDPWSDAKFSRSLQRAAGFDDEAWRLARGELGKLARGANMPAALRESVRCNSGASCVAELYGRLHVMLHTAGLLPIRDAMLVANDDALLPELMIRSRTVHGGMETTMDYDTMKLTQGTEGRTEYGEQQSPERYSEISALMNLAHPLQVDQMQLANFILEVRGEVIQSGAMQRCLEWEQPFFLVRAFSAHCRWIDVFSYSEPSPSDPRLGLPGYHEYNAGTRHYWGDMEREDHFGIEPDSMDLIVCPFVFEHVSQPWIAIKTLARALRPGGFIIWAAPMFQEYHGAPHDYYRYTPKGIAALSSYAGLEVSKIYAPGDLSLVAGAMMGMMLPYWTSDQVLQEIDPAHEQDSPKHPLNVFALLRKPGSRPVATHS